MYKIKNIENDQSFFDKVYAVVRLIPHGKVTSFGAIASCIGSPGAARMVGWALNKSVGITPFVPAHRVVNRNGVLTGKHHFPGGETMKEMLESESVKIVDDQVVDFEMLFWNPQNEL
ncbi:MAG TPA: MGMT family protein [Marinilabiliaceae bacterium]|nr:MGMT family protein [Marinilabiliaceae bacterium]